MHLSTRHLRYRVHLPALAVALILCAHFQAAADPVISAPDQVPVGGLCIVKVDGLDADGSFSWIAVPEIQIADFIERSSGKPVLLVATNQSGTVHLILAYLADEKVRQQKVTIRIGGTTPPPDDDPDEPDEPDDPPPVPTLTTLVAGWADEVNDPPNRAKLAATYQATVQLMDTGQLTTVTQLKAFQPIANTAVLGSALPKWRPFLDKLGVWLDANPPGEVADYRRRWLEIAQGLKL